ncbi:MAG TPA: 30S ribosomal protein S20 [Candidatus Saccharimonadales bacterium]|nr:30S ribosomal protein S20 [Candidatus Saccharimonadales bacterium]
MPIIKSAKKRVRVSNKAAVRNSKTKRSLKTALKAFAASLGGKDVKQTESKAASELDKAAKKGLMHKNKVARKKSQLARAAKAAGAAAPAAAKVKKPAAKKPAAKKAVAKKK